MNRASRAVPAVLLAAALATAAGACSSSTSTASKAANTGSASAGPLAGQSANAIVTKALANTEAASSVHMAGGIANAGKPITFGLTLVRGQGCEGTLSTSKTATFQLVYLGQSIWLKPSDAFYTSQGINKATLSLLSGKYIKVKSTDPKMGDFAKVCTLSGLLSNFGPQSGKTYAATPATFGGQPAIKITRHGETGYAYVSDTASPLLLQVAKPGASGGSIQFTNYNAPVTITAPPAAQTIDGSQLGL
jgi:hypothetical protein